MTQCIRCNKQFTLSIPTSIYSVNTNGERPELLALRIANVLERRRMTALCETCWIRDNKEERKKKKGRHNEYSRENRTKIKDLERKVDDFCGQVVNLQVTNARQESSITQLQDFTFNLNKKTSENQSNISTIQTKTDQNTKIIKQNKEEIKKVKEEEKQLETQTIILEERTTKVEEIIQPLAEERKEVEKKKTEYLADNPDINYEERVELEKANTKLKLNKAIDTVEERKNNLFQIIFSLETRKHKIAWSILSMIIISALATLYFYWERLIAWWNKPYAEWMVEEEENNS